MPKPNDARPTGRPSDDEISKRAYEIYLQRGSLPGYEVDDWLQAEAELSAAASRGEPDESRSPGGEREATPGRRSGGRRDAATATRRTLRQ